VPAEKDFFTKNEIIVNDKKPTDEIVFNQLYQTHSTLFLGTNYAFIYTTLPT
jgi:hypothetical protein